MCSFGGRVSRFYFRYRLSFAPPVIFHNGANGLEFGRAREFPFRYRSCFVCFFFFLSVVALRLSAPGGSSHSGNM